MNRLLCMTILFVLLIQAVVVADQQPIDDFDIRFDSLKAKVTADCTKEIERFRKLERTDYDTALFGSVLKHQDELQSLVTTALSFPSLWGTDENGHKQPFSLIAEPFFIMKDEKLKLANPMFFMSMKRLFESKRISEAKIHDETIARLIEMTDNEDAFAPGGPCKFLLQDLVANGKWNGRLQTLMKQKLERRFRSGDKLSQRWFLFYWFMDWTDAEKQRITDILKPSAMMLETLYSRRIVYDWFDLTDAEEQRMREMNVLKPSVMKLGKPSRQPVYEWFALLICFTNGDDEAREQLFNVCRNTDYSRDGMEAFKANLPLLVLIPRHETVELLTMLMERDDILDRPKDFLNKKGSLAFFSAIYLSAMLPELPPLFDGKPQPQKKEVARHDDGNDDDEGPSDIVWTDEHDGYLPFPEGKRAELLTWLKQQKSFVLKRYDFYPKKNENIGKEELNYLNYIYFKLLPRVLGYGVIGVPPLFQE
ncbi:MAG: hypothetical protein IKX30_02460 [Victivallales bacterium]|nr:hypothetical protein [Victivallales bacterium]